MTRPIGLLTAFVWMATGCDIVDEDRCADGFTWDDEARVCLDDESSEATSDSGEGGTDSGPGGSSAAATLGTACETEDDCSSADDATFCVKNPLSPTDPGICTIPDCVLADCTGDFVCCDCAAIPQLMWPGPLCAANSRQAQLEGAGCSCE